MKRSKFSDNQIMGGGYTKFCNNYMRAPGYFSSSALIAWASLLECLDSEEIYIELIISPELQPDESLTDILTYKNENT